MSAAQVVLAALEATGEVVDIACPGCKAVVSLAELLAAAILAEQSTEAQQVAEGEAAIFAADAAAVAGLAAAHVTVAPSPIVQAAGAAASSVIAGATAPAPVVVVAPVEAAHVQPAGTVKAW